MARADAQPEPDTVAGRVGLLAGDAVGSGEGEAPALGEGEPLIDPTSLGERALLALAAREAPGLWELARDAVAQPEAAGEPEALWQRHGVAEGLGGREGIEAVGECEALVQLDKEAAGLLALAAREASELWERACEAVARPDAEAEPVVLLLMEAVAERLGGLEGSALALGHWVGAGESDAGQLAAPEAIGERDRAALGETEAAVDGEALAQPDAESVAAGRVLSEEE